jgi:hypothetical protein
MMYTRVSFDRNGTQESFVIPDEDARIIKELVNRLAVNPRLWDEQEAKRRERERQQQPRFTYSNTHQGPGYTFWEQFMRDGFHDEFRAPKPQTQKMKLAELAGVDWAVAELMDLKKLLRRAQAKCHPDTGGSHEQWLKLQALQEEMRL